MAEYAWIEIDGRQVYRRIDTSTVQRSNLPFPRIISDTMEPVQSMLDGKYYTSKSRLRATYKAAGCVEVGNDPQRFKTRQKQKPDAKAIKDTLDKAAARYNNGERVQRHKIAQA